MRAKLRAAVMSAGAGAAVTALVIGAATPAFAKSDTSLSGPRVAQARHPFQLTVSVGDDAGIQLGAARLQLLGAHGHFQWYGGWHKLRWASQWSEEGTFAVTDWHRGTETFRAIVAHYVPTNSVTVIVR
jgi:hypothetical protein